MPTTTLHYFDCRSRGQGIRFSLALHGVSFAENRVDVADLGAFRKGRVDAPAPFSNLPVLAWRGAEIAETLAIAGWIADVCEGGQSPEERARRAMITSVAHLEMQVPYSRLCWTPADAPDAVVAANARELLDHLERRAAKLAHALGNPPFFGSPDPGVADAFVYESLRRGLDVYGDAFAWVLPETLRDLERAVGSRPEIVSARAAMPAAVTNSPSEAAIRGRLGPLDF